MEIELVAGCVRFVCFILFKLKHKLHCAAYRRRVNTQLMQQSALSETTKLTTTFTPSEDEVKIVTKTKPAKVKETKKDGLSLFCNCFLI
jgi:hypothetical protein